MQKCIYLLPFVSILLPPLGYGSMKSHSPIRRGLPSTRLAHIDNQKGKYRTLTTRKKNIRNPTPAPPPRKLFHSSTTYVLGGSGMRAIEIECIRENTCRAVTRACHAVFLRVTWCVLNDKGFDTPNDSIHVWQFGVGIRCGAPNGGKKTKCHEVKYLAFWRRPRTIFVRLGE